MREIAVWFWFECPECHNTWGSENSAPDREWCECLSMKWPELIYEEQVQL